MHFPLLLGQEVPTPIRVEAPSNLLDSEEYGRPESENDLNASSFIGP